MRSAKPEKALRSNMPRHARIRRTLLAAAHALGTWGPRELDGRRCRGRGEELVAGTPGPIRVDNESPLALEEGQHG